MIDSTFALRSLMRVERKAPDDAGWPLPSPFDLCFRRQPLDAERSAAIAGTGIYLIARGAEVAYLGKYQPADGNIIADRWGRHLQTITARGYNIGLGGKHAESRLAAILQAVDHPRLRQVLQAAYDHDRQRFRDTGYTTSPNRLRFAGEHWDHFGEAAPERLLDGMGFILLRMRPAGSPTLAKKEATAIEKQVLLRFRPVCNDEYRHELHATGRAGNTVAAMLAAVRDAMRAVTGEDATHCVRLEG